MPLRDSTVTAAAGTPDTLSRGGPTRIYGPTGHTIGRTAALFYIILFFDYFPLFYFSLFSFSELFFGGNGQEVEEEQVSAQEAA